MKRSSGWLSPGCAARRRSRRSRSPLTKYTGRNLTRPVQLCRPHRDHAIAPPCRERAPTTVRPDFSPCNYPWPEFARQTQQRSDLRQPTDSALDRRKSHFEDRLRSLLADRTGVGLANFYGHYYGAEVPAFRPRSWGCPPWLAFSSLPERPRSRSSSPRPGCPLRSSPQAAPCSAPGCP